MALSHAILVSLLDRPQTGYELGKRFDRTVGFFWKASHQQIYQELHKMARSGWVISKTVAQSERPNRIVYALTGAGREALHEWIEKPTEPASVKEELLVKLFALGDADPRQLLELLHARMALLEQRLDHYEMIREQHYPDTATLTARQKGRYLGLRMGMLADQTALQWCREAIDMIGTLQE